MRRKVIIFIGWFMKVFISPISWGYIKSLIWGRIYELKDDEKNFIYSRLKNSSYVILTRRDTHLTTYFVSLCNYFMTGKFGYWGHACMNVEGDKVGSPRDIVILESIASGVKISGFDEVFDCDSCALLIPKYVGEDEWEAAVETAKKYVSRGYDLCGEFGTDEEVNCVELVLLAIKSVPNHRELFAGVFNLIEKHGTLTPDMFVMSGAFNVYYEFRAGKKLI